MELTRTRFCFSMPASRKASSKLISFCGCLPTPLVKKHSLGMKSSPLTIKSFSLSRPRPGRARRADYIGAARREKVVVKKDSDERQDAKVGREKQTPLLKNS